MFPHVNLVHRQPVIQRHVAVFRVIAVFDQTLSVNSLTKARVWRRSRRRCHAACAIALQRMRNSRARLWYSADMPTYYWDDAKDELLRRTRGISSVEIAHRLEHDGPLATVDHHNPIRHPGQRIYIVRIGDYAYRVPFEVTETGIFLRTAYPNSDATRDYLR